MNKFKKILVSALVAMVAVIFPAACGENVTKFNLSFVTNGGNTISTESVEQGKEFTLPVPVRDGFEFDGWYLNADFSGGKVTVVKVEENCTVYAKWVKLCKVTLDTAGGTLDTENVTVKSGDNLYNAVKDLVPQKNGLTFGGWFNGNTEITADAVMGDADITLTARYKVQYTVEVYLQKADKSGYEKGEDTVKTGFVGADYVPDIEVPGYVETDNSDARTEGTLAENAAENVFRHYFDRKTLTLVFNPNYPDGKTADPVVLENVVYGDNVEIPSDFEADGYCLIGWSETENGDADYEANYIFNRLYNKEQGETAPGNASDFQTSVTLYGVWARAYTDMFGGSDKVYPIAGTDKIYIDRSGVFFRGEYDYENDSFLFVGEDNKTRVKGRLNDDRTFVYANKERANIFAKQFIPGKGVDDKITIYFDEYNGLSYSEMDENGKDSVSEGIITIEDGLYTVMFEEGDHAGEIFTFIVGTVEYNGETITAFQKRDEEVLRMGLINRAALREDGTLVTLRDEYYSIKLDGFSTAEFRVENEITRYYYSIDKETMVLTLRNANMQTVGVMSVSPSNGKYVWVPYDSDYDREITVGNKKLTTDGAYTASYFDGTSTITGNYMVTESVFGYIVNIFADSEVRKFLVTSTVSEVTTGEGEDKKTETVTTYSFTEKPAGYGEFYYSASDGIYRLPLLVLDDEVEGKASLYGYTAEKTYVKISSGRYTKISAQYTYTVEEVFIENITIEPQKDENGETTSYIYYITDESTGEKKAWMQTLINIVNLKSAVFAVDTVNTDYNVTYWYMFTENEGEPVVTTVKYTADNGAELTLIGGFAQYSEGENSIIGAFAQNKNGYYTLTYGEYKFYFELNEDNGTFIMLQHAPVTASEMLSDGSADSSVKLSLDGKGGAVYSVTQGEGESATTETYTGTVSESGEKTAFGTSIIRFRETGKDGMTFDFILLATSKANYFARKNDEYRGEFINGENTLTLDGFFFQASYTDEYGSVTEGIYYITEDGGICMYTDKGYMYFDVDGTSFTKRGIEYGTYLVLNNQTNGGLAVTFDGYGKLVLKVTAKNEAGDYETNIVAQDVPYTVDGDIYTFTYNNGYGEVTLKGKRGIYTSGSNNYNAFYVINEEVIKTFVNTNDWSVLSLDGYGNAVKYYENGIAEKGTYMLITDDLLYYLNNANSDACIYKYDLATGTAVPVKFTAFGYYTENLESLVFTKYGFAVFNGATRYYYNVVDGVCYIYHQEFDEQGLIPQETNKYGFIEEVFGEFTDEKQYGGKKYYKDDGVALSFGRVAETADNYKIAVSDADGEVQYLNIGKLTFTPSGGEEFAVECQLQLGEKFYTAYVCRDVTDDNVEMYILIPLRLGYYRLDITVSYTGGGKDNTYDIVSMKQITPMKSYNYLYIYYYFGMIFGQSFAQTIPNTYGTIEMVSEFGVDGKQTEQYLTGTFGEDSGILDINGDIIVFDKATLTEEGEGYVAEITVKTAEGKNPDNYTYRLHFVPRYMSQLGAFGYIVAGFTRVQTLETSDGYTVEVERLIASDAGYPAGYVYALSIFKEGAEIEYDVRLLSEGNWYCVVRTIENDKIVATKYYKVVFTEMTIDAGEPAEGEEEKVIVAPYESVSISVEDVETLYADNGKDYVDINAQNSVTLMKVGDATYAVSECTYDAETGLYTVVSGDGKKFTVKVNGSGDGKTVTITEITETESGTEE